MSNEYYEKQWMNFRKSYDIKNKYHPPGKDYSFMDYRIEAIHWNEPMLVTMHNTIRLETKKDNERRSMDKNN